MKLFNEHDKAISYAEENWLPFFNTLTHTQRVNLLSIQSRGRTPDNPDDLPTIEEFTRVMKTIPKTIESIILYRGGCESDFKRPYVATSFLEESAKKHVRDTKNHKNEKSRLYKIFALKNSKFVPTCALNMPGCSYEEEVDIDTSRLARFGTFYIYS